MRIERDYNGKMGLTVMSNKQTLKRLRAVKLYRSGYSLMEVGDMIGSHYSTVSGHINDYLYPLPTEQQKSYREEHDRNREKLKREQ